MERYKLMWTAFYMPGHDEDMDGYPDIRITCNTMSVMNSWIKLP